LALAMAVVVVVVEGSGKAVGLQDLSLNRDHPDWM
jgi:hypothetical protein